MSLTYTAKLEQENRMLRSELMRLRLPVGVPEPHPMPRDVWRLLIQLAHPDKHGNSPLSTRASQWLMEHRP